MPEAEQVPYYRSTLDEIDKIIKDSKPEIRPDENGLENGNIEGYTLWMTSQIRAMNHDSQEIALKAARWVGYVLRMVEEKGYWDNERSRELIRGDISQQNHISFEEHTKQA
ncbi:hypothetical protein A2434_02035 [Candidatus Woesebacteria bacterium RIFOXYC1_FULL_41_14]|uniref:Uncharacterized protein n=2 Tax=Candidatus Woeseibacteriota TaxID=1752722 RepID=A0A0G0T9C7_9BACT|nr:MAG: hypothetical protein UT76_C0009G0014 [Candidatus Woesebacteria bacterium GW2011_GWB1_40_12]OGM84989.1 MAG: hypothetical protein A2434_02035 [Candidatus Woesebacteria bacterium RIFOXYC1_FULL_41_14]OGM87190.1 MAG: hypothetical protein A2594_02395 [Candidatus Woesebacteria bacterium RIFOXYD1_FULL_41_28]